MGIADSVTYRVETVYEAKDKSSRVLDEVAAAAGRATRNTETLRDVFIGFGAGAIISRAFSAGNAALIGFNSEIEKTKISLATVTAMNLKAPFELARKETDKLFDQFQVMAAQSPATTQDFINMANAISGGVLQAGLGLQGLKEITKGAITASSALGAPAEMLQLDVTQMLAGTVAIRDRYARQLLAGIGEKDYLKFNKYDAVKRATLVQKAFGQDSLKAAAEAQGNAFSGVTSSLKDNIEIGLGKVGLPLFQKVTEEIKRWNNWLTANKNLIDHISAQVSDGLVKGFKYAKDAASFLVDNAGKLMEIGRVWAMVRIAGGVGNSVTNTLSAVSGFSTGAGGKMSPMEASIRGFAKEAALATALKFDNAPRVGAFAGGLVGRGINLAGGLAGAAGSLGLGGALQIGVVAHELGEYLGVHKRITAIIDPQRSKYEQLVISMKSFDDALIASRDKLAGGKGAYGTGAYGNIMGAVNYSAGLVNSMADAERMLKSSPGFGYGKAISRLEAGGLDADQIYKFMNAGPSGRASMIKAERAHGEEIKGRAELAASVTDFQVKRVMDSMSAAEKSQVDVNEGTQRVYQFVLRELSGGKGGTPKDWEDMYLFIRSALEGEKSGINGTQTKAPVTNIKIDRVEVSAKDPDRWIADLDAKARSQVRAPRQPRAAVRGGF